MQCENYGQVLLVSIFAGYFPAQHLACASLQDLIIVFNRSAPADTLIGLNTRVRDNIYNENICK